MAFLTLSMYSDALSMDTNVSVILPEKRKGGREEVNYRKYPVLYCLHGHGDDHTAWIRKSNIEVVARNYQVVVVMPSVQRGYYVDGYQGLAYYTYLTKELPVKMANFFPISLKREDTYIMGNSMGGYGAFRIALANPDKYAAAVALSPALPQVLYKYKNEFTRGMELAVGPEDQFEGSNNDLLKLADDLNVYKDEKPKLYATCGNQDWISSEGFKLLDEHVRENDQNLDYESWTEDGEHNWDFWNPQIKKSIELFGFKEMD